jgi:hypothetical protein
VQRVYIECESLPMQMAIPNQYAKNSTEHRLFQQGINKILAIGVVERTVHILIEYIFAPKRNDRTYQIILNLKA